MLKQLKLKDIPVAFIFALSVLVTAVLGAYMWRFRGKPLGAQDEWGTFGDFVGGTLNPLFGLITILIVVMTYRLQVTQLRLARRAMASQVAAAKETAELTALTAALDALNVMITTKAGIGERSTVEALLAVSRREAIIRRIIMIADIEVDTGRDIQYPVCEDKDELD